MPSNLTAHDIYEKQFAVKGRGYDAEEVDDLLDLVIEDYQEFEEQTVQLSKALLTSNERIEALQKELEAAVTERNALVQELEAIKAGQAEKEAETAVLTLEERIARLEKAVFASAS